MKIEKFLILTTITSKIILYGFSLFAIIFLGYLLITAINHYILKYLF